MKFKFVLAFCVLTLMGCSKSMKQDKPEPMEKAEAKSAQPQMTEEQMMEAMKKASAVGENHKLLASMAGEWTAKVKMYPPMGGEPKSSKATVTTKPVMDGRFVESNFKGTMMGQPFTGREVAGFDNMSGKFFSVWYDSMSTNVLHSTGTYDPVAKQFTYKGEVFCPVANENVPVRMIITVPNKNSHKFEWYETRNGEERLGMEIDYTRKGKVTKN